MVLKYIDRDGVEMNSGFMQGFDESFLAELGRVIAAWSHVEYFFDIIFLFSVVLKGKSSGSADDPNMVHMGKPFKQRVDLFRDRLKEVDLSEEDRKLVEDILSRLKIYRDERDRIAHSLFNPLLRENTIGFPKEAVGVYQKWKGKRRSEFKPVTLDDLQKTFGKIHILYQDVFDLLLRGPLGAPVKRKA